MVLHVFAHRLEHLRRCSWHYFDIVGPIDGICQEGWEDREFLRNECAKNESGDLTCVLAMWLKNSKIWGDSVFKGCCHRVARNAIDSANVIMTEYALSLAGLVQNCALAMQL